MTPIGEHIVGMEVPEVNDNITRVTLNGQLDTPGVDQIETNDARRLVSS